MTKSQKLELLRIGDGAGIHTPGQPRGAISVGTHAEKVLKAMGLIEDVPESAVAIFARNRAFVRLTDAGFLLYTNLLITFSRRRAAAGDMIANAGNDNE